MRKLFFNLLLVFCLFLLLIVEAKAQIDWKKPGPRPVGMGTAFVSTSTREYSVFWNPAGLGGMQNTYLHFSYANFCKIDLNSYYASFITPLRFLGDNFNNFSFGIDWLAKQDTSNKLDFNYDQFHFAIGGWFPDRLKLGASLNLKGGMKFGTIYHIGFGLTLAGTVYNDDFVPDQIITHTDDPYTPISSTSDAISENEKHWNYRIGLSFPMPLQHLMNRKLFIAEPTAVQVLPPNEPILAVDWEPNEKNIYAGTEVWFYPKLYPKLFLALALRAGTRFDLDKNKFVTATAGLTLKFDISKRAKVNFDFAYVGRSDEEKSGHGGATIEIEAAPTPPPPPTVTANPCPNKILLSWPSQFIEEEQGFHIQKSPDGHDKTFTTITTQYGEDEGTYPDGNVEPGKTYYYRIIIFSGSDPEIISWVFDVSTPGVSWSSYLKIFKSSSLDTIRLAFGQAKDAKDGLDPKYCEKDDPLRSSGLDARFIFPDSSTNSFIDFRKKSDLSQWTINLQYQAGDLPLKLVWNNEKLKSAETLKNLNIILRDKKKGIDKDMKTIKEYSISDIGYSIGDLIIVLELVPVS